MDSQSTAGAEDRDRFTRLDARTAEHLVRRRERIGDDADLGRMRLVVEPDGQLDEDMGWKLDVLGIATVAVQADIAAGVHAQRLEIGKAPAAMAAVEVIVGGHAVAHCKAGHAGADVNDLARDLVADYAGNSACLRPALMCWIVNPDPQVMTRATASPGPATGSGSSTNSNGVLGVRSSIAFMAFAPSARQTSITDHDRHKFPGRGRSR